MAITLPDARSLSDEVLEALRLRALFGREMGYTEAQIADLLGVSRETVSRWWSAYRADGLDGLPGDRTGRPLGSGRTLTDEQARHLQQLLDDKQPRELGIAAPLWNRRAIRDLIHREFGFWMPLRTVGEYLKRWGYTAKKPSRRSRQQVPEEVYHFVEEQYPALEAQAQQEGADIQFADETGVQADAFPGTAYARKGEQATIDMPRPHIRTNVIASINREGDLHYLVYPQTMKTEQFVGFLQQLIDDADRKIILLVDRHPTHDNAAVEAWVAEHKDQIEVVFLPRYAPERNPVEYLNNDLKGNAKAEGLPNTKAELRGQVEGFMSKWAKLPEHVMSYFLNPWVEYAAGPL